MSWGIFDTVDELWLGDDQGPRLFEDETVAKIAAQVADVRLRQDLGRSRAKEFPKGGYLKVKDELELKMSGLEAIKRIERGAL